MKVYIVGGNGGQYTKMFIERGWNLALSLFEADLVQFTGGEDVTPEIYGQLNTESHNNYTRDHREAGEFAIAKRLGKPMAGICRGGQFLNVMCGGSMIQHVEGHATGKTHLITNGWSGEFISVTSTHHQMMVAGAHGDVEAWATIVGKQDPEVIMYDPYKVLCFQPHPEFDGYKECQDYYFELLETQLGLSL